MWETARRSMYSIYTLLIQVLFNHLPGYSVYLAPWKNHTSASLLFPSPAKGAWLESHSFPQNSYHWDIMYRGTFPSVFPFAALLMLPKKLSMRLDSRRGNMTLQPADEDIHQRCGWVRSSSCFGEYLITLLSIVTEWDQGSLCLPCVPPLWYIAERASSAFFRWVRLQIFSWLPALAIELFSFELWRYVSCILLMRNGLPNWCS